MFQVLCTVLSITVSLRAPQMTDDQSGCQDLYVLKSVANIRNAPSTDSARIGAVVRNTSLARLEEK